MRRYCCCVLSTFQKVGLELIVISMHPVQSNACCHVRQDLHHCAALVVEATAVMTFCRHMAPKPGQGPSCWQRTGGTCRSFPGAVLAGWSDVVDAHICQPMLQTSPRLNTTRWAAVDLT
jgi:hypothetical protein